MPGTGMADDQMDDETLIIPSRPIPSKAVINFAELHQIRDILYVPTDSYTTGTAALSRWGRLAVHTKYSCSPFPPLSLRLSLCSSLHLPSLFLNVSFTSSAFLTLRLVFYPCSVFDFLSVTPSSPYRCPLHPSFFYQYYLTAAYGTILFSFILTMRALHLTVVNSNHWLFTIPQSILIQDLDR